MIAENITTNEETDLLIVGAGPAGASLACFLAEYGLKGILIAAAPGTADTPRAHITNMAALECLRDIDLEEECLAKSTSSQNMEHTRWCHSMAGEEYARIHSWGHDPHRHGDYADASPCTHVDLPQTLAEPIFVNRAKDRGWDVRFNTALVSFDDRGVGKGILSTIKDTKSGHEYTILSRFLFGADGARSQVVRQLDFPLIKKPGSGLALNVLVETDLSHLVETRNGNLHWVIQPDRPHPRWARMGLVRMVKPWHEWMFIVFPVPGWDITRDGEPTEEEYMSRVREFIGDDKIPAKLINVSKWAINEIVAENYSSENGNIHCLGDAVHRHPPFNGLGSNTCVQDAYNLAWKIAYVMRGQASQKMLTSYSIERQPVGLGVITRANQGFRDHYACWEALGVNEETLESSTRAFNELKAATPAGAKRRKALREAISGTAHEFHAVGQEMNQRYDGSPAIYFEDETQPRPPLPGDAVLEHQISTYPGARLPHAWVNTYVPNQPQISTHDLAGHGHFTIFSGPGDEGAGQGRGKWHKAAENVSKKLDIEIKCVSIGYGCEWQDVYFDWEERREVGDDGCVLVRPDRFVAWRSHGMAENPSAKVESVLKSILCLDA
ncbi:hypothetical protein LTS08_005579 [Lithohypha guttulata]|nr:hypothetical protein LTS08_005579 [Lithohypha guttulata]